MLLLTLRATKSSTQFYGLVTRTKCLTVRFFTKQMASIAVSLSGGRRAAGSLPHPANLRTCASTEAIKPNPAKGLNDTHRSSRMASKQLRNELELMRKIIQEKDALIQRCVRASFRQFPRAKFV